MRILVTQLAKMGDLLQTAPLLERLREAYPGADLHLLHSEMFSSVARRLGADRLHPLNLDDVTASDGSMRHGAGTGLEGERFDLVVNPSSNRLAADIARSLGAPVLGHGGHDLRALVWLYFAMSFIHSRRLQTLNLVDIYRQLVPVPSAPHDDSWRPQWEACSLVGVQLASRNQTRQWPPEQFAAFADRQIESGAKVRLFGTRSEAALGEDMLRCMGRPDGVENLMGRTDVDGLFVAVGECDVLLTGDTGVMHVAASVGTPVAAVFLGPANPWETLAWGRHVVALWPDNERYPCYPCHETAPCLQNLLCHNAVTVDDVWSMQGRAGLRMAGVAGDALGQVLSPLDGCNEDEAVGLHYRAWAADWLLSAETPAPVLSEHTAEILRRELRLWERLAPLGKPPREIAPSFRLLTPLVWFAHLCRGVSEAAPQSLESWLRRVAGIS